MVYLKYLFIFFAFLFPTHAEISIHQPKELKDAIKQKYDKDAIPVSIANFGHPPYGRTIVGNIIKPADEELYGCLPFDSVELPPYEEFAPSFLILNIGICPVTIKVKHAQEIGIHCVIIINDDNSNLDENTLYDDAVGTEIIIPSLLITKSDGQLILDQIDEERDVEIAMGFNMRKSYKYIDLQL